MKDINLDFRFSKLKILPALCFILSLGITSAGCSQHRLSMSHREVSKNLSTIKSVCLVELQNKTSYPQISEDVTESLNQSLQKKQWFALSLLKQTDAAWKALEVKPDSAYTLEQLMTAHKLLGTDALLIGTITSYSPYPRMAMGLQLKLVDLRTGQVVWAIQQIWDAADKATQERIKRYFDQQLRTDFSPIGEQLATLSPINFIKFITYEVTEMM
jgi:Peptidoglycan-synthase activator LpoB